jgi:hypothetical protein
MSGSGLILPGGPLPPLPPFLRRQLIPPGFVEVPTLDGSGVLLMPDFPGTSLTQGGVAVSLLGHGAADHGDVTRYLWLDRDSMPSADGGTTSVHGTAVPNQVSTWLLADAATQGMFGQFGLPSDTKANSNLSATIIWTPVTTDGTAHTVRWSINAFSITNGATIDTAGTTTTFTGASAARTVKVAVFETTTQFLTGVNAGELVRFNLRRIGADAADTYVGSVHVEGIRIDYTAVE